MLERGKLCATYNVPGSGLHHWVSRKPKGNAMSYFPVIRVYRPFLDSEVIFHCAMIACKTAEEAVAAYRPEPGDKVEFAWWDVPHHPEEFPAIYA
jgi:hypothetical protein